MKARYSVSLPEALDDDLETVRKTLGVSKGEVFRRALLLFKHAVDADKVELTRDNEKQAVLLR